MLTWIKARSGRRMGLYLEKGLWILTAFQGVVGLLGLVSGKWMEAMPFVGGALACSLVSWDFFRALRGRPASRAVPWLAFAIVMFSSAVPYGFALAREHRLLEPVRRCVSSGTQAECIRAREICGSFEVRGEDKPEICLRLEGSPDAVQQGDLMRIIPPRQVEDGVLSEKCDLAGGA